MPNNGSRYMLNGYSLDNFKAAFEAAYDEKPEVYYYMLSLLKKQPIDISGGVEIIICEECGFWHPGGTCLDS